MRLIPLIAVALAACSGTTSEPPPSPLAADTSPSTRITGTVIIDGAVPAAESIRLDADPQCAALAANAERTAEDLVLGDGNALQNAFVYVKHGLPAQTYPTPANAVVLDQQTCRYAPRVLGLQVGQSLTIRNSDPLLHTVRADSAVNDRFNVATPIKGIEITRRFASREVMVPIGCDVHPWMSAYVGVLDHPFFDVTRESGRFTIAGLPPGTYTLEVWHERLGTQTREVTVSLRKTEDVTVTYKLP